MKNFKKFIWLLFFVFVFILFEFGLFCTGRFLLLQRRVRTNVHGIISVVCIGDSHTFGVGTSAQYSYPKQEETLLNINNRTQRFSVVNLGIPGSSTKRQAQELQSYLKNNHAEIVVWLTGRNNDIEIKQWGNTSLYNKIAYHLSSLRSFKFLKVISDRFVGINKKLDNNEMPACDQGYADYLNFLIHWVEWPNIQALGTDSVLSTNIQGNYQIGDYNELTEEVYLNPLKTTTHSAETTWKTTNIDFYFDERDPSKDF